MTWGLLVFQAEQFGQPGVDSREDASTSTLGRGSNVSTDPPGGFWQPRATFREEKLGTGQLFFVSWIFFSLERCIKLHVAFSCPLVPSENEECVSLHMC